MFEPKTERCELCGTLPEQHLLAMEDAEHLVIVCPLVHKYSPVTRHVIANDGEVHIVHLEPEAGP
jgi:hypothetical protein